MNQCLFHEEVMKELFETVFVKQKPNLIEMNLRFMRLFPNSFRLFTEKRWEKLNYIKFCKFLLIQCKLASMINVPIFFQIVNYLLWKNLWF